MVERVVVECGVAPVPPDRDDGRAGHLFAVELGGLAEVDEFGRRWMRRCAANDDWAAHRSDDGDLRPPMVRLLPAGRFLEWMAPRGRLGGQNKVPRVAADATALRTLLEPDRA